MEGTPFFEGSGIIYLGEHILHKSSVDVFDVIYDKYIYICILIATSTFHCKQTGQKHIRFFMSLPGWSPKRFGWVWN